MIKVIIRGYWASYAGADYCEALGIYPSLDHPHCLNEANIFAYNGYEPEDEEENGIEDEGLDYWVEEYDPEVHDMLKRGGGSFKNDFSRMD